MESVIYQKKKKGKPRYFIKNHKSTQIHNQFFLINKYDVHRMELSSNQISDTSENNR